MSIPKPTTIWRRLLLDEHLAVKHRIEALQHLERPSIYLLRQVLSNWRTPARLRFACAKRYEAAIGRKELMSDVK